MRASSNRDHLGKAPLRQAAALPVEGNTLQLRRMR